MSRSTGKPSALSNLATRLCGKGEVTGIGALSFHSASLLMRVLYARNVARPLDVINQSINNERETAKPTVSSRGPASHPLLVDRKGDCDDPIIDPNGL